MKICTNDIFLILPINRYQSLRFIYVKVLVILSPQFMNSLWKGQRYITNNGARFSLPVSFRWTALVRYML
jgi:hypothetical protein